MKFDLSLTEVTSTRKSTLTAITANAQIFGIFAALQ
jgi:hypothetical protein